MWTGSCGLWQEAEIHIKRKSKDPQKKKKKTQGKDNCVMCGHNENDVKILTIFLKGQKVDDGVSEREGNNLQSAKMNTLICYYMWHSRGQYFQKNTGTKATCV